MFVNCLTVLIISNADKAASDPLFPIFVPHLSIACSIVSVINIPKVIGIMFFTLISERCLIVLLEMYLK